MSERATALLVKQTGHVLGVATRVGDPEGELKPEDLAGARFPVRDDATGEILVEVEAEQLAVAIVPMIDDLLLNPQLCVVEGDEAKEARLLDATTNTTTATLTQTKVTVTVASAVADKTAVWVQVESGSGSDRKRDVFDGEIAQGDATVEFAQTFSSGTYDVLALAAGFAPGVLADQQI